MMTILDKIIAQKRLEVASRQQIKTLGDLEKSPFYYRQTYSLREWLIDPEKTGIIAEFKRQSPSKGLINGTARVQDVTTAYAEGGASCLSVLTDSQFFGGYTDDLIVAREYNKIPILRKDFMIDSYQVHEAKAMGADVILLIAACLSATEALALAKAAKALHLEVLMEIHTAEELSVVNEFVDVVGVNNRNLKDFTVDIQRSIDLATQIPAQFLKISESGISNTESIVELRKHGFQGFLIGENFMKTQNPGEAFNAFVGQLPKRT